VYRWWASAAGRSPGLRSSGHRRRAGDADANLQMRLFVYPIAQLMAKLLWQHAVADAVQIDKRLVNRVDLRAAPALQAGSLPG